MTHEPLKFVVVDPRGFDGDPFEVAGRACAQAQAVARILATCVETANIMARNSEMSRQEQKHGDPQAAAWEDSVWSRKFAKLHKQAKEVERELEKLKQAAEFDPKHPPKA